MSECNICGAPIFSNEPVTNQPCLDCIMDSHPALEMLAAIRAWFDCSPERRPSNAALGQRISEIASTVPNGEQQ